MLDVSSFSSLSGENLQAFWAELMLPDNEPVRNQFLVMQMELVERIAKKIRSRLPRQVELQDLMQCGLFGLHNAMLAFDPTRGVKFSTFAAFHIRGAIFDELRSTDWVPRLVRKRTHLIERAINRLEQHLGRKPTERELRKFLNLTPKAFAMLRRDSRPVGQVSLSQSQRDRNADHPIAPGDTLADRRAADPAREAQRRGIKEMLSGSLNREERLILTLYYYEGLTMKEIGAALDLSESRISQLRKSILKRLKATSIMEDEFKVPG